MSMLRPATKRAAFAKVGLYGTAGAGKTYLASLIAIGLHKYAGLEKPVGFFDTEPAASYVLPLFEEAGIPLLVYDESRALADLMRFMDDAEAECSVVIIDSITHVWRDAQASYLKKINENRNKKISKLEFHHWGPIKGAWATFTDRFLASKLHVIVCGRAGLIYEYQLNDETNKRELISTGSRMATEKELGYEPSLLVELAPEREEGKIVNRAYVQKDRTATINGQVFDYPTFTSFLPHFEFLNLGGDHSTISNRDSTELFGEDGSDQWTAEQRNRTIWAEEVQALMTEAYPGQTQADKKAKAELLRSVFDTGSWTKVESMRAEQIKAGYETMKGLLDSLRQARAETEAEAPKATE
jgi:hypothetical protein